MTHTTGAGHGGKNAFDQGALDGVGVTTEWKEVTKINNYFLENNPAWKDVSNHTATNVPDNLYQIVEATNALGKAFEITLSHHMNAFNRKASGVEVWYYLGDAVGKAMAERLSAAISKALGLPNRGAKATTDLYVVANTIPHCVLIEWIFVDNPSDMAAWNTNKYAAMNSALRVLGMNTGLEGGKVPENKPPMPVKNQPKHYILTGGYDKTKGAFTGVKKFLDDKGMAYKLHNGSGNIVYFAVGTFPQGSEWKQTLFDFLHKNQYNYITVYEHQIKLAIEHWSK